MLHYPKRRASRQRLFHCYIDAGAGDTTGGERLSEPCLVDDPPASHVDEIGGGLHATERLGVDEPLGLLGQRTGQRNNISFGQQGLELAHGMHRICRAATRGRIAPQPDDAHIEGFGELGEASANLPQADDRERLAAELILPLRGIADHAAPDVLCLVVTCLGKPAAQCEDQGHRVLGDRSAVDAARAGKADVALRQLFVGELVSAGADRLDEAEVLARSRRPFPHSPEIRSTSASPTRFSKVLESRTAKLLMPVLRAENRSRNRYAT
jgi:hypothetical protein